MATRGHRHAGNWPTRKVRLGFFGKSGCGMGKRVAAIIVGLAMAGVPVHAEAAKTRKPAAAHAARTVPPQNAALHAAATPDVEHTGSVKSRKGKGKSAAKGAPSAAVASIYAAMPEAERLAIQANLAWVGFYEGSGGGDFDDRTVTAVRGFQQHVRGRETGVLSTEERDQLAAAARPHMENAGWRLTEDIATGARIGLPEKLVPQAGATRTGSRWTSAQGQIKIETFRLAEASLPALFDEEKKANKREVLASALKPQSFVISGVQGLKNFIVRAQASGSELRGITILYDQATEGIMGPVAAATANAFEGFPDPNAAPLPGQKRVVEYASAIVVSSDGDLLASGEATDQCQALTVQGFGHAERIAADKTGELALLRLYGAHNLVPMALADGGGGAGELTLVGVADPLGQAGDGAATSVKAKLGAQGIEPAPKLGFSGAAAVDAEGRLAGMVELKSAVVAGAGSAGQQAALVRAETIRAFLQANGIKPAALTAHAASEQSVMRVICVRK
jgi:peptidoglycan hydrolase-like protein with peptidoglycan-binding domain